MFPDGPGLRQPVKDADPRTRPWWRCETRSTTLSSRRSPTAIPDSPSAIGDAVGTTARPHSAVRPRLSSRPDDRLRGRQTTAGVVDWR